MTQLFNFGHSDWAAAFSPAEQAAAVGAVENTGIVIFPHLAFVFADAEQSLFNEVVTERGAKNVSYNAAGEIGGVASGQKNNPALAAMLKRYANSAQGLLKRLLPAYATSLDEGKVSFRPAEVAGRKTSWRKDDTRLHVDAFPSNPTLASFACSATSILWVRRASGVSASRSKLSRRTFCPGSNGRCREARPCCMPWESPNAAAPSTTI
jgi:hypothetical protein